MLQIEKAKKGVVSREVRKVSKSEGLEPRDVAKNVSEGKVVILANRKRKNVVPLGVGGGLRTKVNANIGTSIERASIKEEIKKLKVALEAGADTVMDLSTGGDIDRVRKEILNSCSIPVGTVPIYQAVIDAAKRRKPISGMCRDEIFSVIEKHVQDGVDFITVHCGVTFNTVERLKKENRIAKVVSRGGAFLVEWMMSRNEENPLYEHFDRLLDIARTNDVVLSLGDGMRPGSVADSTDRPQIQELILLGELAKRARDAGVQVMIEGPGHIPLHEIQANVMLEKTLCDGAPFYVLGPVVTDAAPGYDHIVAAIGGATAAACGADFLGYDTCSEHLRLPMIEDVREGVIVARIAAHSADIVKGVKGSIERDIAISKMRQRRKWKEQIKLAIDPLKAGKLRSESKAGSHDVCTMCGKYCSMKRVENLFIEK